MSQENNRGMEQETARSIALVFNLTAAATAGYAAASMMMKIN